MLLDLVYHPRELVGRDLSNVGCVVLDVLRATTTMINALANDASEIHVYAELDDARAAHAKFTGARLLAGERGCLPPEGFDLGNSPGAYTRAVVAGKTIFMSTTNGTRAIHACRAAANTFVAALVNASATARALEALGRDVVFVCAGVDGAPGGEDVDAAATIAHLLCTSRPATRTSTALAEEMKQCSWLLPNIDPRTRLAHAPGGVNLRRVGLDRDIDFASRLDRLQIIGVVEFSGDDARVVRG